MITFEPFELETSDLAPKWAVMRGMGGYCLKWEKLYSKVTAAYLLPISFLTIIFEPYELETSNLVPSLAIVRGMCGYRQK